MKCSSFIITMLWLLLPMTTTAQNTTHCRYCYEVQVKTYSQSGSISNIFTYPARSNNSNYTCFDDFQRAKEQRNKMINSYDFSLREYQISDACNAYEEEQNAIRAAEEAALERQQKADAARFARERQLQQEEYQQKKELQDAKRRREEENARQQQRQQEQQALKAATLDFYRQLDGKPKSVADGWHRCTVIHLMGGVTKEVKFRVKNNKVVEKAADYRPQYDRLVAVSSGPIVEGKVKVSEGNTFYDVIFMEYIQDKTARAVIPVQDERAIWWLEELNATWQKAIAGEKGTAYIYGQPLSFDRVNPTGDDLDNISSITSLELPAESWVLNQDNLKNLCKVSFASLKTAKIVLKGADYAIHLSSPSGLQKHGPALWSLVQRLTSDLRKMLAGQYGYKHGAFSGDFPIRIDLYNILEKDLTTISNALVKVDRLNLPPEVYPNNIPFELFPNLKVVSFQGNTHFNWGILNRMPEMDKLQLIDARDTPAAGYWHKKLRSRKKQKRFVEGIRARYPQLDRVEFGER